MSEKSSVETELSVKERIPYPCIDPETRGDFLMLLRVGAIFVHHRR